MDLNALLGDEAESLLSHTCKGITARRAHPARPRLPRSRRSASPTARPRCCATWQRSTTTGRLAGTGYVSILPVDQGIEHSAAAVVRPEPGVLRPGQHRQARHRGRLQRRRLHLRRARRRDPPVRPQDPVHREDQPQRAADLPEQVRPDHVRLGARRPTTSAPPASAPPSTSAPTSRPARSRRSRRRSTRPTSSACSPCCGATCATTRSRRDGVDYHVVGRPHRPGQPPRRHHRGRHHQAEAAGEQRRLQRAARESTARPTSWSTTSSRPTTRSTSPAGRWPTATWAASGSSTRGGESKGASDLADAVRTAVINKRAGGMGLISGRKAFQRPMAEGVELLNAIQDVYLDAPSPSPDRAPTIAGPGQRGTVASSSDAARRTCVYLGPGVRCSLQSILEGRKRDRHGGTPGKDARAAAPGRHPLRRRLRRRHAAHRRPLHQR